MSQTSDQAAMKMHRSRMAAVDDAALGSVNLAGVFSSGCMESYWLLAGASVKRELLRYLYYLTVTSNNFLHGTPIMGRNAAGERRACRPCVLLSARMHAHNAAIYCEGAGLGS
jgi:hypothetical protein